MRTYENKDELKNEINKSFVVICQNKRIDENLNRYQKDVGIVAQTMLLAAVEQGLGGCGAGICRRGPFGCDVY